MRKFTLVFFMKNTVLITYKNYLVPARQNIFHISLLEVDYMRNFIAFCLGKICPNCLFNVRSYRVFLARIEFENWHVFEIINMTDKNLVKNAGLPLCQECQELSNLPKHQEHVRKIDQILVMSRKCQELSMMH